jgi:hypothetical protein
MSNVAVAVAAFLGHAKCARHVHDTPLTTSSTHMSIEDRQDESDSAYALSDGLQDVRFATIEEKKRLWSRDAIINSFFIASWSVRNHRLSLTP